MADPTCIRLGTWNLEGRWSDDHAAVLNRLECDIWLLTEVARGLVLPGYAQVRTEVPMTVKADWAAVLGRPEVTLVGYPDPASVAARVGDHTVVASVLPWRSCGDRPWGPGSTAERTALAVGRLRDAIDGPHIWGGDFNHSLTGSEYAGSLAGRAEIMRLIEDRRLQVPTAELPHRLEGVSSIDHVAVPAEWSATAERIEVERRLSDHDIYVVSVSST